VASSGTGERLTLDVPADWERSRLNRHSVGFFDYTAPGRWVVVDLQPLVDTVREARAERRGMRALGPRYYREHEFRVSGPGAAVRVRWVYSYRDAQTEDTWSWTSVYLVGDNRLVVDGRRSQRAGLEPISRHVVGSVETAG
jgi:hypothetical protein